MSRELDQYRYLPAELLSTSSVLMGQEKVDLASVPAETQFGELDQVIIELTGIPGIGKSTNSRIIINRLNSNNISSSVVEEVRPGFDKGIPGTMKREWFNLFMILKSLKGMSPNGQIALKDRCFYNSIPFNLAEIMYISNQRTKKEYEKRNPILFQVIDDLAQKRNIRGLVIVLPTQTTLSQYATEGRTRNIEYLTSLTQAFQNLPEILYNLRQLKPGDLSNPLMSTLLRSIAGNPPPSAPPLLISTVYVDGFQDDYSTRLEKVIGYIASKNCK